MRPPWKRTSIGDLQVYQASTMSWLPGIVQGFTTRHGGVSIAPYDRLNLGSHVGDDREHVQENRKRIWSDLGFAEMQVAMAEQVHGDVVEVVTSGGLTPAAGADALVTASPNVLLMLYFADCVPVYLVDPVKRVVGLAHAGWRGTAANISGKTLQTMQDMGCLPEGCFAAIGPSIAAESYIVGRDVADVFRDFARGRDAGAATAVTPSNEFSGKFHLNLRQILFNQLLAAGVKPDNIAVCREDTRRNERDFFSYRRDGITGRMAAYLGVRSSAGFSPR